MHPGEHMKKSRRTNAVKLRPKATAYFLLLFLLISSALGMFTGFHYFFGFGFISVFGTAIYFICYLFYLTWLIWDPEDFK